MKKMLGLLLIGMLVIGMVGCSSDTDNTSNTDDTQVEVNQPVEEPVEEPKEEPVEGKKSLDDQIEVAEDYLTAILLTTFGEGNFKILTEGNRIGVFLNMPRSVMEDGIYNPDEWNTMVESMKRTNNNFLEYFEMAGCIDLEIGIIVGDFTLDETYLAVRDGIVYYDIVNGIDNLH